ncbi:MAG TPA: response regulator transcription factor [Candidatus Lustribacter sp.]|nr:response regulator transcription factor [Candidatus Lustribacter sp.]
MSTQGMVLVVEDDHAIATMLTLALRKAGYDAQVASDGDAALAAVAAIRPDAVLLDVGLPGRDGIDVCRQLRARGDWTPVLFVTARDDEIDRIVGLELGADDYITKPFSPREVVARIGTVLRRVRAPAGPVGAEAPGTLVCGPVTLLPGERRVTVDGAEIDLTATEFDLLAWLMRRPGQVYSRSQLMEHVWGYDSAAGQRTVDVHVAQLRAKLAGADVIRTVRGVGYAAQTDRP